MLGLLGLHLNLTHMVTSRPLGKSTENLRVSFCAPVFSRLVQGEISSMVLRTIALGCNQFVDIKKRQVVSHLYLQTT